MTAKRNRAPMHVAPGHGVGVARGQRLVDGSRSSAATGRARNRRGAAQVISASPRVTMVASALAMAPEER